MATPGSLTIGGDSSRINSTQNSNNSSATRTKGENGFTILASVYNPASDNYIRNYQAIVFDAVTDTGVRRQADITSYPVESGAEVSDHIQIKNNTFKMSGVITETPIRLEEIYYTVLVLMVREYHKLSPISIKYLTVVSPSH